MAWEVDEEDVVQLLAVVEAVTWKIGSVRVEDSCWRTGLASVVELFWVSSS